MKGPHDFLVSPSATVRAGHDGEAFLTEASYDHIGILHQPPLYRFMFSLGLTQGCRLFCRWRRRKRIISHNYSPHRSIEDLSYITNIHTTGGSL